MIVVFANVIFPAFSAPYFSPFLFPLAGLAAVFSEFVCYSKFSPNRERPDIIDVIGANVVSWLVGVIISFILPNGLVPRVLPSGNKTVTQGPHFMALVIAAFFVACALSIAIEFAFIRWRMKRASLAVGGLFRLATLANCASYIVLFVIAWVWVTWMW